MHVLVVEDDPQVAFLLRRGLEVKGHVAEHVATGIDAVWAAGEQAFDAIVLDVDIPEPDGFEVCRRLRADGVWTPIVLLTGRAALADRVTGLDAGADDFLAKPFEIEELMARLRAVTRRAPAERPTTIDVAGISFDPANHQVARDGTPVSLPPKALAVLEVFLRNPGQVLTRGAILERAWGGEFDSESNLVDVYVRQLRTLLDVPFGRSSFETVRGLGYRLNPDR